ncbi:MAG: RmlC-like protein, partial [Bacilli bacterium]|nr:RmlC-like protein [Bacilli bacterium]
MPAPHEDLARRPFKLAANRVWRTYHGGKLIDAWQGSSVAVDNQCPEDWVASVVTARNPGREQIKNEGLSLLQGVEQDGDRAITLKHMIEHDPARLLGAKHASQYGSETGVLVKILDAAERLTIQTHPDRQTAKQLFQSDYGKTEAWYILGGREIDGEQPYVLFGFKPGVTREQWEKLFWAQDIQGMIGSLHKFYVEPGQVFLVEGGIPHAIGPGCFLIEIQEPTDYTIRIERVTPAGYPVADQSCHQGIGFDKMFDCFHYDTYTEEQVLDRWRLQPVVIRQSDAGQERALIDYGHTPYFRMHALDIVSELDLP